MDQEKLVAALKCRDAGAIEELVETHGNRLLRSAFMLCGNEADAQDLVQDTFVEALRSAHRFQGRSSLYTWLHSILLNLTRHHRRDSQRMVYDDGVAGRELEFVDDGPSGLDVAVAAVKLAEALRELSTEHREVIVLRYYEHKKIQEMAAVLGVSLGTVKSRLHYAIAELQKLLPAEMNLFGTEGTKETETT